MHSYLTLHSSNEGPFLIWVFASLTCICSSSIISCQREDREIRGTQFLWNRTSFSDTCSSVVLPNVDTFCTAPYWMCPKFKSFKLNCLSFSTDEHVHTNLKLTCEPMNQTAFFKLCYVEMFSNHVELCMRFFFNSRILKEELCRFFSFYLYWTAWSLLWWLNKLLLTCYEGE